MPWAVGRKPMPAKTRRGDAPFATLVALATKQRHPGIDDARIEARLKWMMFVRLLVAMTSLGAFLLLPPAESPGEFFYPPYVTLVFASAVNLVYLFLVRAGTKPRPLAVVQYAVDLAVIGALSYFLGPQNVMSYFYFAVVIGASFITGQRAAVWVATAAAGLVLAVALVYYFSPRLPLTWGALRTSFEEKPGLLAGRVFFFSLGLYALAVLAGRFSEEVSRIRILNDEILQNMAGGVMAVDRFGVIAFANPQFSTLLGIRQPLVGRGYAEVLPAGIAALFKQALAGGDRVETEIADGGTPVRVEISRLADGRAGPRGVVAIVNDQTMRTRVEQLAQRAERFRALLEMSAGMAHEIRNPLASIRGAAQELTSLNLSNEDDRRLLQVVIRESDRLDKIITDFLEYASDRPMQFELVNVPELMQDVTTLLETRDPERRVTIALELPRTLVCRGDPDKLKQVFLNLAINALEAIPAKGKVTIRALSAPGPGKDPQEGAEIMIEDTGAGIAPEDLPRIFDPFFTTKPTGTGMGLAIARKIVQGHDGTISAESKPGKGTTIRVWLPGS